MKNRRTGESNEEVRGGQRDQRLDGADSRKNAKMKMRRNIRRLGGRGLSLEAFANVKSGSGNYNPSLIKKQREFYKNAKYVRKYKKSLKQDEQEQNPNSRARFLEELDQYGNKGNARINQRTKENKKKNFLSLKEVYENKREEEEKVRIERETSFKAKEEQRQRSEARRKDLRLKMLKKTRSGQPVMKYRIEHMLETLQGSTS